MYSDDFVICKKGLVLLYLGEFNLVISEFDIVICINEESVLVYVYWGRVYLVMRLWRKVEEDIEKVVFLDVNFLEVYLFRGMY